MNTIAVYDGFFAHLRPTILLLFMVLVGPLDPVPVVAQDPGSIVTDRPDQTESAESVPAGFIQLELGWIFTREEHGNETQESHSLPETLLRVGMGHGLEVRLGFSGFVFENQFATGESQQNTDTSETGDAEIGFKYELGGWSGGQVAFLGDISIPMGQSDFSNQYVDPSFRLLVAHSLGERLSLGYNIGVEDIRTKMKAPYTIALGVSLSNRFGAFIESFGAFGLTESLGASHSLDGGFTFLASDALQFDVNVGVGLNETAEDWFIGGGFAFRLPHKDQSPSLNRVPKSRLSRVTSRGRHESKRSADLP